MSPVALEDAGGLLTGRLLNRDLTGSDQQSDNQVLCREIEEIIQIALHSSGFFELRRVEVLSLEGHVTLHGTVSNYYLKQVAQTVAGRQKGVGTLANRIRVSRPVKSGSVD